MPTMTTSRLESLACLSQTSCDVHCFCAGGILWLRRLPPDQLPPVRDVLAAITPRSAGEPFSCEAVEMVSVTVQRECHHLMCTCTEVAPTYLGGGI